MRFTYFRSEPRRLHATSPRSSASRGVSTPSALQGSVHNRNRDLDDERGRPLADRERASRWFSSLTKRVASRSTGPEISKDRWRPLGARATVVLGSSAFAKPYGEG